jgi:antitoxin VapB
MPLNIKNREVEKLIDEVVSLTGETKTEAVRQALRERRQKLGLRAGRDERRRRVMRFLEAEVWPKVPPSELGRELSHKEEDEILGYGPEGV